MVLSIVYWSKVTVYCLWSMGLWVYCLLRVRASLARRAPRIRRVPLRVCSQEASDNLYQPPPPKKNEPLPPPPKPPPKREKRLKMLYDYETEDPNQLAFKARAGTGSLRLPAAVRNRGCPTLAHRLPWKRIHALCAP